MTTEQPPQEPTPVPEEPEPIPDPGEPDQDAVPVAPEGDEGEDQGSDESRVTTTSTLRDWWSDYRCDRSEYERVAFPGDGREWNLYIARGAVPAYETFAAVMDKHRYLFRESSGGTYNCRPIGSSGQWSLHAYAIAIDLNPSKNPYKSDKTDMPKAFTDEVLGLRTGNGKRVFTWGMNWEPTSSKDPMHFQIDCSPADIKTGIKWSGDTMAWKSEAGYTYTDDGEWPPHENGIKWTINEGLLVGDRDEKTMTAVFNADRSLARGEAATVFYRIAKDSPTFKKEIED